MAADPVEVRLTKIEAELRTLDVDVKILKATAATKEDLARAMGSMSVDMQKLTAEMHKEFSGMTVRMVTWMIAVVGLGVGFMKFLPERVSSPTPPAAHAQPLPRPGAP